MKKKIETNIDRTQGALTSTILEVFKDEKLTPEQGCSVLLGTTCDILQSVGILLGVKDTKAFIADAFKQALNQL